ncbi:MAG: RES family NAD+ phosphorylase [Pyrinomonadaceae bacterium]
MIEVFRLSPERYARKLSGRGSARLGARWNSAGVELVYTASNRSLAMAEVLVHLSWTDIPNNLMMAAIGLPDDILIENISDDEMPSTWNIFPHTKETQEIGDRFVAKRRSCVLRVPSVVTRGDFNLLINPHHPQFPTIKILRLEKFKFDRRLFR